MGFFDAKSNSTTIDNSISTMNSNNESNVNFNGSGNSFTSADSASNDIVANKDLTSEAKAGHGVSVGVGVGGDGSGGAVAQQPDGSGFGAVQPMRTFNSRPPAKDNTLLFAGGGLVVAGGLFLYMKKSK